jgi:hypothetical protein
MQVWAIARARAIIGGPNFEARTASRKARFHWMTTLSAGRALGTGRVATAVPEAPGSTRRAPLAPAAKRNCRRDMAFSTGKAA